MQLHVRGGPLHVPSNQLRFHLYRTFLVDMEARCKRYCQSSWIFIATKELINPDYKKHNKIILTWVSSKDVDTHACLISWRSSYMKLTDLEFTYFSILNLQITYGKKLDYLQLEGSFSTMNENRIRSNQWHHSKRKIIVVVHTSNHNLATGIGRWSSIPILWDKRLCHFYTTSRVENEAHFVLECPLYNTIKDKFPSLFENVITY